MWIQLLEPRHAHVFYGGPYIGGNPHTVPQLLYFHKTFGASARDLSYYGARPRGYVALLREKIHDMRHLTADLPGPKYPQYLQLHHRDPPLANLSPGMRKISRLTIRVRVALG